MSRTVITLERPQSDEISRHLYINGCGTSYNNTEEEILSTFESFGAIEKVELPEEKV